MTGGASGRGRAALVSGDVEFDQRDAALLREVGRAGSVARASSTLGRSRARALARIEVLEEEFGALVERRRGGSDGGGSRLTGTATDLLTRFSRLQRALSAAAAVPETVLDGRVESVDGELATVATDLGAVSGRHGGLAAGDRVQARLAADAVTVLAPDVDPAEGATSARNRFDAVVRGVDPGETVATVALDIDDVPVRALVTTESADRLELAAGRRVLASWKATATPLVREPQTRRSKHSR